MPEIQNTITSQNTINGVGLHTGLMTNITFKPAKENNGICFIRTDLEGHPKIAANLSNFYETKRSTQLKRGVASVQTTEHLLAAVKGLEIDNLIIEIDGPELPILDGSSKPFVDALLKCGIQKQDAKRKIFKVNKKYHFKDEETQSEYTLEPYNGFKVDVTIDYESKVLPKSEANLNSIDEFVNDISPSRTFVFLHEIQSLFNLGLIQLHLKKIELISQFLNQKLKLIFFF